MTDRSLYLTEGQPEDLAGIANRVANISVSAIKQMPVIASKIPGCVSLGQGIPSLDTPLFIRESVSEALLSDDLIGKYSLQPGMPQLKSAIAKRLQTVKNIAHVDSETELVITCGAMEGLAAAIATVVERGDEVIIFSPSYSSHIEQVLFAEGVPVFVPLNEADGWSIDTGAFEDAISDRTKAVIVCSPSNPTGAVFSETQMRRVAEIAIERNIFVIADEAYDFLVYDDETHFSLASIPELKQNLIATYSFSKMYCMTGYRIGYVYASKRIVDQILKVHDAFAICAPTISQYAALAGLRQSNGSDGPADQFVRELVDTLRSRRDLMCDYLGELKGLFEFQVPKGAYYVFPKIVPDVGSTELSLRLLHEARVITIPGNGFGPMGEGRIRLSFGASESVITDAMTRITQWTQENGFS